MLTAAEADVAVLGELKLASFAGAFVGLLGLEEELVVVVEGDGILWVVYDADVDDGFF